MAITNTVKLPSDDELKVDQEITLSTPWLKAVAPYMARACEQETKEFMLRRKELEDPRLTLKEGKALTDCGAAFLRKLKRVCTAEVEKYADCIDHGSSKLYVSKCREEQRFVDRCIEEELKIERPKIGYFSKIHVHESAHPRPEPKIRDYQKEAAEVLKSLPKDYHLRKDYKRFQEWRSTIVEN